ncbi:MAG: phosphoenolpyruvate--protein phosphotransferase [Anaerolineae bacterium]|nr:phosphoenolpyruvate--protein phosphotransferase [Anaerolineae bacterium]
MLKLKGVPASAGMAQGPAYVYVQQELRAERRTIEDPAAEWARLESALERARTQLAEIQARAQAETGAEEAAIFEAHAMFLDDPSLLETVQAAIEEEHLNAEAAWMDGIESFAVAMEAMKDEYLRARAADIRDVGQRVLRLLLGKAEGDLTALSGPSIVVARDLTPSDTVRLDKRLVLGFCTAEGGPTSHTAILAKALQLPAVVGVGADLLAVSPGTLLLLDGVRGEVVVDPDEAERAEFAVRSGQMARQAELDLASAHEPAITRDGRRLEVVANIGNPDDAAVALRYGAEGVGLFRTEFLYLDRQTPPDEEEQVAAYRAALDVMGTRPVVVRTLDVGGDKPLPYLDLGHEDNPFLGWRAIRMCLDQPEFFKIQLRALWRASPGHDLRIMFPMIATVEEVRRAKALLEEARGEVVAAGYPAAERLQVGIMVEVPSVAVLADRFVPLVDFFSIGTNDLTQYTLAAERTNPRVAHLGDPCHPAVLRQIQRVIEAAHAGGIWVGVCGEMAGDPEAAPVLLGLGLDEFSMAPGSIPRVKAILRSWSTAEAARLAAQAVNLDSAEEVRALVRSWAP